MGSPAIALASLGDVVSEDVEELVASLLDGEPDLVMLIFSAESISLLSASPLIPTGSADMLTTTGFS